MRPLILAAILGVLNAVLAPAQAQNFEEKHKGFDFSKTFEEKPEDHKQPGRKPWDFSDTVSKDQKKPDPVCRDLATRLDSLRFEPPKGELFIALAAHQQFCNAGQLLKVLGIKVQ